MTKKMDREVVAAKVAIEEEWAYDRRIERLSWRQMRDRSALPVERGGLGYPLGIATLQARAGAYFEQIRGRCASASTSDGLGRRARSTS